MSLAQDLGVPYGHEIQIHNVILDSVIIMIGVSHETQISQHRIRE